MSKYLIISILFLFSCSEKPSPVIQVLQEYGQLGTNLKVVYVIAENGCHGCIEQSVKFARQEAHNQAIRFIITKVSGKKSIKLKYGVDFVQQTNLLIDTKNLIDKYQLSEVNPVIYFLDKSGNITQKILTNPKNLLANQNQVLLYLQK